MTDTSNYRAADDKYEAQNDYKVDPTGDLNDDSYVRSGDRTIPVQKDSASIEDPIQPPTSNSDAQLEQDEKEAIDKSNIIKGRTRHAKPVGSYSEGPDEDDLPKEVKSGEDGTSATR
ncbi:hypothetical protein EDD37DRAFT_401593 [Exophiala viscosa]|uniref:Histone chaperone domain-containing protein n=1 Tax=Exophiala viscosa TaxID=2486360 RepID=A0AAN6DZ67_9EURO|nr:hypothetical protein EDD36DRAFT_169890 [Exophiala viscosa]KAI1624148.1 hypothetical protein EDD37DRAFT_401593 [Exophiala viscosa]